MSVINSEFEVSSSLPADKLFKLCDGGVGSIKSTTYGDAIPYTSAKYKIDAIDANNFTATYSVIEGDDLLGTPSTHHFKIVPSANGGTVFKDSVVHKCNAKPTEETFNQFKELFKNTFKAHEAYAIAHPEVY
nr:root allergen protein-like [Tanacetum cinerariifolium]